MAFSTPAQISGQPNDDRFSIAPAGNGAIAAARLRGTLVTVAAAARSSGGTTAITYDWRAGTSICAVEKRSSRNVIASPGVGINAATISMAFDGRWLNTIVLMRPNRAASADEMNCENELSSPAAKKNVPATCTERLKRRNSHSASSDWITNPPPSESILNSAESRNTIARDFASGADLAGWRSTSMAGERRR